MGVVALAGGTGGAKLAAGLQEILGSDLSVVANTADDCDLVGLRVSPDPDLVTYWLAGEIDEERGWGIRGDGFVAFERLVALGAPDWFRLSDRDLATCLYRTHFLAEDGTPTAAQAQIAARLGVAAAVLPMCDEPVRTRVLTAQGWREFQEYLILDGAGDEVKAIELAGIESAQPTGEVFEALAAAEAIVIGPSNPVVSIGPILTVPGMREAMAKSAAPVVAVSPFVAGRAVKGPTELFMAAVGRPATAAGVADLYAGVIDGIVVDEGDPDPPPDGVAALVCPTLMAGMQGRRDLARRALDFAASLA